MHPDDLENVVDRALKQLPSPRAPRSLMPRVLAAIETQGARPATRPWLAWPLAWQVASVAALVVVAVGVVRVWPGAQVAVAQSTPHVVTDVAAFMVDAVSKASAAVNVIRIVWRGFVQPLAGYLLLLVLVMSAACATFGAVLGRVALGGVSQT